MVEKKEEGKEGKSESVERRKKSLCAKKRERGRERLLSSLFVTIYSLFSFFFDLLDLIHFEEPGAEEKKSRERRGKKKKRVVQENFHL